MSLFPPGYVTIGHLGRELATPGVDANPLDWQVEGEERSDLRRDIALAIGTVGTEGLNERPTPGVLQHVRLMWQRGEVTPRSPSHAFPPTAADQISTDWLLSSSDAARVAKALGLVPEARTEPDKAPSPRRRTAPDKSRIESTSRTTSAATEARWGPHETFKKAAVSKVVARHKQEPFANLSAAARWLSDESPREEGGTTCYTPDTCKEWLKEAGLGVDYFR